MVKECTKIVQDDYLKDERWHFGGCWENKDKIGPSGSLVVAYSSCASPIFKFFSFTWTAEKMGGVVPTVLGRLAVTRVSMEKYDQC